MFGLSPGYLLVTCWACSVISNGNFLLQQSRRFFHGEEELKCNNETWEQIKEPPAPPPHSFPCRKYSWVQLNPIVWREFRFWVGIKGISRTLQKQNKGWKTFAKESTTGGCSGLKSNFLGKLCQKLTRPAVIKISIRGNHSGHFYQFESCIFWMQTGLLGWHAHGLSCTPL